MATKQTSAESLFASHGKAHVHVYTPVTTFGEKRHQCTVCKFSIPDNLLRAALNGGAKLDKQAQFNAYVKACKTIQPKDTK